MYRLTYQDYRLWREVSPQKHPPIQTEIFVEQAEAVRRKEELKRIGLTACVTLVPDPRANGKGKQTRLEVNGERFNQQWRLSREPIVDEAKTRK